MKPSVGQRWKYQDNYLVEIIELGPGNAVKIKVLQKKYSDGSWTVGEIFSPVNLTLEGPRVDFWTLLEGQDAPK